MFLLSLIAFLLMAQPKCTEVPVKEGTVRLIPMTDNSIRVRFEKESLRDMPEWIYVDGGSDNATQYKVKERGNTLELKLKNISVICDKATGLLVFRDSKGSVILTETRKSLQESSVQGEKTYIAELSLDSPDEEALFGLGQFQDGYLDVRGLSRRLTQVNTQISIPFVLSSRGFGLLWNNYGLTEFNPADESVTLVKTEEAAGNEVVDVTSTQGNVREMRRHNIFAATLTIPQSGRYALLLDVGQAMARRHHLVIDGNTVLDQSNLWLPPTSSTIVELEAGTHQLQAQLSMGDAPVLYYKKVENESTFRSPVADCVDYTVFAGEADEIISAYRTLTGEAPLMPRWALGYIHCRERFHSSDEILSTAREFRERKLPMDVMVQDWQYWGKYGWNAMRFDEEFYPDPKALVDGLHKMDARFMISVWSKVDPQSEVGNQMQQKGYFLENTTWVDFFNPDAADFYWSSFSKNLLKKYRIDAWWQDATEPENDDLKGRKVMDGTVPGEVFRNVYPLLVNKTVYEGCRTDDPSRRTMILTRSGFPGIQRYGTAMWSGDVGNDWETLKRQITGGLDLMASGIPWWTYDAGGFFRPRNQYEDRGYQERMLRWLQTSVFLPLMRVHGYMSNTEFWNYGEDVTRIARRSLELRYRLFPYIYSENARVSFDGSTLMRPLVMDFRGDEQALTQKYEYMFGPSILVAPVVEEGPSYWPVYLPKVEGGWYDLYSGDKVAEGINEVAASLERIPAFVKAGSILPLAEGVCQTTEEAAEASLEIHIFPGADGFYELYEDEGINYGYEKGVYSKIPLKWDDSKSTLTIGPREGSYPGMAPVKTIKISKAGEDAPVKEIRYEGMETVIRIR